MTELLRLDPGALEALWLPTLVLAVVMLAIKPGVFNFLFVRQGERDSVPELGYRLGQTSEFSLIIALTAETAGKLSTNGSLLVQYVTILTLLVSSYIVVFRYPSPLGRGKLKQD